jgi:hypothetical protein
MPLFIQPKKGIRLQLTDYSPIRSWQGGGKFWEHDFQLTIRQGKLAEFLPRALEEGDSVFYEQVIDGREATSESVALSNANEVPPAQIETLRAALAELKAKAEDPLCDATKRRIIESFRLPDPAKDTDLYRLWGRGRNRRLLVLWGVEKEAGSALVPLQALALVPQRTRVRVGAVGKSWLWLLALAALLAGGWFFWPSRRHEHRDEGRVGGGKYADVPAGIGGNPAAPDAEPAVSPGGAGGGGTPEDSPSMPARSLATGSPDAGQPGMAAAPGAGSSPDASPGITAASPSASATGSKTPAASPGSSDMPSGATPTPAASPTAFTASPSLRAPQDARQPAASPSPVSAGASPRPGVSPFSFPSSTTGKVAPRPDRSPAASPAASPTSGEPADSPAMADSPGEPTASASPSPADAPRDFAPPADTGPSPDDPSPQAPPPPLNRVAPAAPEAASLQIVSARSGSTPKNGRMEVLLSALARDASGTAVEAPKITEWRIDNTVQRSKDGSPITGSALPAALSKGTHHVTITGLRPDGRPLKAEADVEVNVKVTEEGSVRIRPVEH